MTTAAERKAKREKRRAKEERRKVILSAMCTGLKHIGAFAGTIAAAAWLALAMQENPQWWMEISWGLTSLAIGAFLFHEAAK